MNSFLNSKLFSNNDQLMPMIFFSLASISIAFFMFYGPLSRYLFYILTYISILYFLVLVFKIDKKLHLYLFPTLFFLLGLSKLIWICVTSSPKFPLVEYHYLISGKRMLLGSFILYCIQRNKNYWYLKPDYVKLASYLLLFLLAIIAVVDTLDYTHTGARININADSATSGAYTLVIFSMLTVYCLHRFTTHFYRPLCLVAIGLTVMTLLATETRSALIVYAVFIVFCLGNELLYGKNNHKHLFISIIVILGACISLYGKSYYRPAMERLDGIRNEAQLYTQGQNSTSLGARFSLWKSAWYSFEQHPFGQSVDSRNALATQYIYQHEAGNQIALSNVQFHMHNDLLDTLSLQGIFGGLIMLSVFVALLFYPFALFQAANPFLLLSLPVITFSQVDCQFYNRESPYFIMLVLGFLMMVRLADPLKEIKQSKVTATVGKSVDAP